jgi:hypothetical protein
VVCAGEVHRCKERDTCTNRKDSQDEFDEIIWNGRVGDMVADVIV